MMLDQRQLCSHDGGGLLQRLAHVGKFPGRAELAVFVRDELGVFIHEDFARRAEIELRRLVAEEFAVDARPDEASVRVDVDLRDAELGGGQVLVLVHAARARVELAAGGVYPLHFGDRDAGTAVHHDGRAVDAFLDFVDDLEVQALLALELVRAVAGADGRRERVAPGAADELDRLRGVRQAGVAFIHLDVFLHSAEHAEFRLDAYARRVRAIHDALGYGHVLLERFVAGVDHHRTVKARLDAVVARLLVAMVQMHREDRLGDNLFRGADDGFEHALVGVFARAPGKLDDERSLAVDAAAEEARRLFEVVDVIGANRIFAVSDFVEAGSWDDHRTR